MDKLVKAPADTFDRLLTAYKKWQSETDLPIPHKKQVHPKDLSTILPYTVIMDYCNDGVAKYKLIGEQIKELYSRANIEGQDTSNIRPLIPQQIPLHKYLVHHIIAVQCGVLTTRSLNDQRSIQWIYDVMSLPLIMNDEGQKGFIVVGSLTPNSDDMGAWSLANSFDIENTIIQSITRYDLGYGVFDFPDDIAFGAVDMGIINLYKRGQHDRLQTDYW